MHVDTGLNNARLMTAENRETIRETEIRCRGSNDAKWRVHRTVNATSGTWDVSPASPAGFTPLNATTEFLW